MHPRVSVIVPGYGVAAFLDDALTSLQRQTLPAWEAVVIDDGDPVRPEPSRRSWPTCASGFPTANHGVSAARNTAVAASHAPLIALLDGDDLFRPTYLATLLPILEADPTRAPGHLQCAHLRRGDRGAPLCGTRPANAGTWLSVLDRSFNVYIGSIFRRADSRPWAASTKP
jgi:glycosyltransferase involved in cell wall biosynthesis